MIKVLRGDCLLRMKDIKSHSIDLILCDLPYGTSACKWDSIIDFNQLWNHYKRLIKKKGAIVLFGSEPFSSSLRLSNLDMYKYDWKWHKSSGANFLNFKYQPAKVHEDIMVFAKSASSFSKKGSMKYFPQMSTSTPYIQKSGNQKNNYSNSSVRSPIQRVVTQNKGHRYPKSIQFFSKDSAKLHPTQKPVALLEFLIKTYTVEKDVVLDNCMGSGSTGIACINTNRNFIGIEKDMNYFITAKRRLKAHKI